MEHWFWCGLTLAVLVWYSTVTIYIAWRGWRDIRTLLRRLSDAAAEQSDS